MRLNNTSRLHQIVFTSGTKLNLILVTTEEYRPSNNSTNPHLWNSFVWVKNRLQRFVVGDKSKRTTIQITVKPFYRPYYPQCFLFHLRVVSFRFAQCSRHHLYHFLFTIRHDMGQYTSDPNTGRIRVQLDW